MRTIAALQTPIVTGIGHETDFTLADFASDLRAPTPTAAAEMVTPNLPDLQANLQNLSQRLQTAALSRLSSHRSRLSQYAHRLSISSPLNRVNIARQRLDEWTRRLELYLAHHLESQRSKVELYFHRLEALNPQVILERGYALLTKPEAISFALSNRSWLENPSKRASKMVRWLCKSNRSPEKAHDGYIRRKPRTN